VLDVASAGALGTVTVDDQRSYIKIETLHDKNPTKIRTALLEVCGEQTVDCNTDFHFISFPITHFHVGCVTINNDSRPGRPKTSTHEQSVQLVEDFLAGDRRVTCKEISQGTGISLTYVFRILTNNFAEKKNVCPMGPSLLDC
jgi:hypothetical protein